MVKVGKFPSEIPENVFLSISVVQVVLAPQDVGAAHKMVVHGHREVVEGICPVSIPGPRMGRLVYSHGHEVPDGRVLVPEVGLDHQGCLVLTVRAVQHHLPLPFLFRRGKLPVRTFPPRQLQIAPILHIARADIGMPHSDEFRGQVDIEIEPVALDDHFVILYAEPAEVLYYAVVGAGVDLLRIGILHTDYQPAAVSLDVLVVEYDRPGMAHVQRTGRPGG